jgi:hypothetical protein
VGDETYDPARLVVWSDRTVRVYGLFNGRPAVVAEGAGDFTVTGRSVQVTLDDGTQFIAEPRSGCGCGNPLKRWPYAGLPS